MTRRRRRHHGHRWRSAYLWHRYLGLGLAVFIVVLAGTGLALNHSHALGLDARYAQSKWLLDRYGIAAPRDITSFEAGGHWISQVEDAVFFDDRELTREHSRLVGAVGLEGAIAAAFGDRILLLTTDGAVIESVTDVLGAPIAVEDLGLLEGPRRLILHTASGDFTADPDLIEWRQVAAGPPVQWSRRATAPAALSDDIIGRYRGSILSYEGILLDVHSGRILGSWGVYVVDAAAGLLVLLALLGIWTWAARRRH